MSDHVKYAAKEQVFDSDDFVRCPRCLAWINRRNPLSVAEHRGPLPHPAEAPHTAWADEDE